MRTISNILLLIFGAALILIGSGLTWLGGPLLTSAEAQGDTLISIVALETDEVLSGERIAAAYELSVDGGDLFEPSVSSSICGPISSPATGDDDDDDELDEGETWVFGCGDRFSGATDTITVFGRDEDGATVRGFDTRDVSYLEEDAEDDQDDQDGDEVEDEAAAEDDADEADDSSGSSNLRRVLFWGMAGVALLLSLLMLAYLLWRKRRPDRDQERLFL